MASNPRALVARVIDRFLPESAASPRAPMKATPATAADYVEGRARLPLVWICDTTSKTREIVGQTGTATFTDPTGRGRTVTINRLTMDEYALIPDTAIARVTVEIIG